jgi:ABC-2 type transport system permease protein
VWALVGVASAFAVGIVKERADGTFYRLKIAPVSRAQLILGKGIACFLSCVIVISFLLMVGRLGFGLHIGNLALTALAVVSASICFVGVVMTLSVLGKSEQATAGSGRAILILFSMFGGGMVPLFMMPSWMQAASSLSPAKWAVVALEGSIWRGFTFAEMLTPCLILIAIGVVGFAIGSAVLTRAAD